MMILGLAGCGRPRWRFPFAAALAGLCIGLVFNAPEANAGAAPKTKEVVGWEKVLEGPREVRPPRGAPMAFDSVRGRTVMFGGNLGFPWQMGDGTNDHTWEWDGKTWQLFMPANRPPPRSAHALAYDKVRSVTVLFGGYGAYGELNDTWEWDGETWRRIDLPVSPAPRIRHVMAFHEGRGVTVLFGGFPLNGECSGSGPPCEYNDTWIYDGKSWTEVTPLEGPRSRFDPGMAYHSDGDVVVLYGGATIDPMCCTILEDTWEWNGVSWIERSEVYSAGARWGVAMAYDSDRHRTMLFGGLINPGSGFADTWEWNGETWFEREFALGPPPTRWTAYAAYDSVRSALVLGTNWGFYEWRDLAWSPVPCEATGPPTTGAALVYDKERHQTVLFGGMDFCGVASSKTWAWDHEQTTWVEITPLPSTKTPGARWNHAMSFDEANRSTVLFGGRGIAGLYADTWVWDGSGWSEANPDTSPPGRAGHAMAYDPATQAVVLFGGCECEQSLCNDVWSFDGASWSAVLSAGLRPGGKCAAGVVSAPDESGILLYGGQSDSPIADLLQLAGGSWYTNDTWTWNGLEWAAAAEETMSSPPARWRFGLVYHAAHDAALLFGGSRQYVHAAGDTWEWSGSAWLEVTPAGPSPAPRAHHVMAYDSDRERTVLYGGYDGATHYGDTWEYGDLERRVNGEPCADDAECMSGSCTDGYCCESAACPACEACDATGTCNSAAAEGLMCAVSESGLADGVCSAGACVLPAASGCACSVIGAQARTSAATHLPEVMLLGCLVFGLRLRRRRRARAG